MSSDAAARLGEGLSALGLLVRLEQAPSHHHARAVLVSLGELVLEDGHAAAAEWIARATEVVRPLLSRWTRAVEAELRLASDEHFQSVDPRYLGLANYDLGYTLAARERLEARFAAADALGLEIPFELLERVAEADALLETFLRAREHPGSG